MGASNVQFQMIANKLANEILQCSIDFFNKHRDENSEFDPGDDAIKITKYAKSIGATGHTKDRIIEAMSSIQEWVDDRPNRERQEVIAGDLAFVTNKLQWFKTLSNSIDNSRDLVVSCKPKLINIKNELGSSDDFYLQISSAVVGNAMGLIIEAVNDAQSGLEYNPSKLILLPDIVSSAVSVLNQMDSIDMNSEVRNRYNTNKRTINSINSELEVVRSEKRRKELSYLPWVIGIGAGIIGALIGEGSGFIVGAIIGAIIGNLIKNN